MKKNTLFSIAVMLLLLGGAILYIIHDQDSQSISLAASTQNKEAEELRKKDEKQYEKVKAQLEKDYAFLYEQNEQFQKLHDDFGDHDFLGQNVKEDGPSFANTFVYLTDTKKKYDGLRNEVFYYLNEEIIEQRSEDIGVEKEFKRLYIGYAKKNFAYLLDTFQSSLPQQIQALEDIFTFLKEHQTGWAVDEKGIIFDDAQVYQEYQRLLEVLENGGTENEDRAQ